MNIFMLFSATMTALVWIGHARADLIPESTADIKACQTWAETHKGTIHYESAIVRCEALANCMQNQSASRAELRECIAEAESQYQNEIAGKQPLTSPPSFEVTSPIVTETSDSDYERKVGKGYEDLDAAQGD